MDLRASKEALRTRRDELRSKQSVIRGGRATYGPYRDSKGDLLPEYKAELDRVETQLKQIMGKQMTI